jgi:hypothetical protein
MRIRSGLAAFLLFATVSSSALAAPATPEQATELTASLQAYFSAQPGVVTVTPNGEAYDLKLDFNPLFAKAKTPDFSGEISPQNMTVSDQGGGKWQVTQEEGVTFKFTSPGTTLSGSVAQLKSQSVYDEAIGAFVSSTTEFTNLSYEQSSSAPGEPATRSAVQMKSGRYETVSAAASSGGVDGSFKMSVDAIAQNMTIAAQPGATPTPITITAEKFTQDGTSKGLRVQPLKKLFVWAIANAGAPDINSKQPELKKLISGSFPAFDNIKGTIRYEKVNIGTPVGPVGLDAMNVDIDMNGLVANGQLGETFTFEGLRLPPGLVPPFAADLVPQKLTVDFKISDFNLADSARIFIEQVDFASKADLPKELSDKLMAALLPGGSVSITTAGTNAMAKAYDLKIDGAMKAGPAGKPSGSATIKLKGFDEVVKALQAAPPEMQAQQAMGVLVVAKGMAKQEGDTLSWVIDAKPEGAVLVNGIDVSKMGGGG